MSQSKVYYKTTDINNYVHNIIRGIHSDNFRPDYVVGLTRGGLIPAVQISHYLNIPMNTLKVSLRDEEESESNLWMAEDAFNGKNILIVDDICDTGSSFNFIKTDWQSGCFPNNTEQWDKIWHNNVKFAVCIHNEACNFDVDYSGLDINKVSDPQWCVFPWENWW